MRKTLAILAIMLLTVSCGVFRKAPSKSKPVFEPQKVEGLTTLKQKELLEEAYALIGTPYRYGGTGPEYFDCSGFTCYVYEKVGFTLFRRAADQYTQGRPILNNADLLPGDLVFFARKGRVFHVGIVVETDGNGFKFIHAGTSTGVTISSSENNYWKPLYYGAKRIIVIQNDTSE
ncbi:MAG: C40 family peptidase [Bacteroidales bacterium]|nr:C40 family peptidase [Bacteroidales bacterium]MDT3357332.1 C40 family peptidase [Bacteroidota bacterium]